MRSDIVKIVVMKNPDDKRLFVYFGRRLQSRGYFPTDASINRIHNLIRQGGVSFYPILERDKITLVLGRKGY